MSFLSFVAITQLAASPITLDEVRTASRQSLDAVRAQLDLTRAQVQVKSSRSVIFPQLDFTLGAAETFAGPQRIVSTVPQTQPDGTVSFVQRAVDTPAFNQGRFTLGLQVNQLIYDGGRWWNQLAQSGAQEEAARGQLAEQQLSSEMEASRRFFELLKAQLALKVFEESVKRSQEQLEKAKALYEAGRGQRAAVYDVATNLGNDEINVVRQRQRIGQARLALLQWLGRGDEDVEAIAPAELEGAATRFEVMKVLNSAKQRRPLFKSLDAQTRAGELGISVARADYLPRLAVSAGYARTSPTADPFFTDPLKQNALNVGASLSWDLFSGFQHEAQIEKAQADLTQVQAQRRQAFIDLEAEVRRAVEGHEAEVEVLAISERNFASAKEQVQLEEARFSAGAGSTLEVRNAQVKYTQAQLAVLQGRADVATARAALERAVGGSL